MIARLAGILVLATSGCMASMSKQEQAAQYTYTKPPTAVSREAQAMMREKGYKILPSSSPSFRTDWHPQGGQNKVRYDVRIRQQSKGCKVDFTGSRSVGGRTTRFPDYDLAYELMIRVDRDQAHHRPKKNASNSWWHRNTHCTGLVL